MDVIDVNRTKQYSITISPAKNRAYLKIIGFWRGPEVVNFRTPQEAEAWLDG